MDFQKNHSSHIFDHHVIGVVNTNCYILGDPKEAILFDPGGEKAVELVKEAQKNGIEIRHVIATHGHFDHLGWAGEIQKAVEGAKVYLHKDEQPVYEEFIDWMSRYGISKPTIREPDIWVQDRDILKLGGYKFEVIHTPGHSPGSAVFRLEGIPENYRDHISLQSEKTAFVGDTIFANGIGRVDLPHADKNAMISSLKRLINEISAESKIYPGHGPETVMENELKHNPYLKAIQNDIPIF